MRPAEIELRPANEKVAALAAEPCPGNGRIRYAALVDTARKSGGSPSCRADDLLHGDQPPGTRPAQRRARLDGRRGDDDLLELEVGERPLHRASALRSAHTSTSTAPAAPTRIASTSTATRDRIVMRAPP